MCRKGRQDGMGYVKAYGTWFFIHTRARAAKRKLQRIPNAWKKIA